MRVIGEAGDGAQAVAMAVELRPDVVLMDIRVPEVDGVEATRRICRTAARARTRVLVLTTIDLHEYVYSALLADAGRFLLKDTAPDRRHRHNHVSRVLAKLGRRDRVQTVVHAHESGLVRPGDTGLPA
ncbi:response regulator [Streptomyces sp. STR69]|uniref:response regulator n=1 Tax=Streptomyces sp. STR69 TaxID=1796942 RepID=UPI003966CB55